MDEYRLKIEDEIDKKKKFDLYVEFVFKKKNFSFNLGKAENNDLAPPLPTIVEKRKTL